MITNGRTASILLCLLATFCLGQSGTATKDSIHGSLVYYDEVQNELEADAAQYDDLVARNPGPYELQAQPRTDSIYVEIDAATRGAEVDAVKLSTDIMLSRYTRPEEQGLILYTRAKSLWLGARTRKGGNEEGIIAAQNALRFPLLPVQAMELHVLLGQRAKRTVPVDDETTHRFSPEKFAAQRRAVVPHYLRGVKVAVDNGLPFTMPEIRLPQLMERSTVVSLDPEIQRKVAEESKRRKEVFEKAVKLKYELQEATVWIERMVRDIAAYYAQEPYDMEELRTMAHEILADEEAEQYVMSRAEKELEEWQRRGGSPALDSGPPSE